MRTRAFGPRLMRADQMDDPRPERPATVGGVIGGLIVGGVALAVAASAAGAAAGLAAVAFRLVAG